MSHDLVQVFKNLNNLQMMLSMRPRYLLNVLNDAVTSDANLRVEYPKSVCLLLPQLVALINRHSFLSQNKSEACVQGANMITMLASFDSLQPPSTWVQSWSEALATSAPTVEAFFETLRSETKVELELGGPTEQEVAKSPIRRPGGGSGGSGGTDVHAKPAQPAVPELSETEKVTVKPTKAGRNTIPFNLFPLVSR